MEPSHEPHDTGPLYDASYVNAMSHFYRGELGRIMIWRQRLDVTTTWAITATTTIFTVAFTVRDVPHIIFFFNIAILWIMLWIEGRRYRFYDAFRARVRMLEAHFLAPMVMQKREMLAGDWRRLVAEDLLLPRFKITRFEAIGRRLKRNYAFIFVLVLVAWITKIYLHSKIPITSLYTFYENLKVGGIPSWLIATVFLITFASTIGVAIYIARTSSEEVSEFGEKRWLWRI